MKKFQIEIEEVLQRVEEIEANCLEEALDKIEEKYSNEEIILDYNDFKGHEIREFDNQIRIEDFEENSIVYFEGSKSIVLEGNEKLALIKKLGTNSYPYLIVEGVSINTYKTSFVSDKSKSYKSLYEATSEFEEFMKYANVENLKVKNEEIEEEQL